MTNPSKPNDAIALAAAIDAGEVSAREAAETSINAIEKHNPTLNAVIAERFEEALAEVDAGLPAGPLHGVPIVIKDLGMQVAGLPATRGSRLWADYIAPTDSELVRRYKQAGMVVLGTTNSPELGKNASTEPVLHGPTRNPWATSHSPGGSSGGSAACVAAGLVPVGHGNDGGGSIRIPASACGLFGLKPSRGRITTAPAPSSMASPLAINHVLTTTVRDSALLLDLTAAPLPGDAIAAPTQGTSFTAQMQADPGQLRIGLVTERADGGEVSPEVIAAVRATAAHCEALGHVVEEVSFDYDHELLMQSFANLMGVSLLAEVDGRLAELGRALEIGDLEPFSAMMYEHYSTSLKATDVYRAMQGVQESGWQIGRMFTQHDLLLTPTLAQPVPELGVLDTTQPAVMYQHGSTYSAFTATFNVTGMPAMSVPAGLDSAGLPMGAHFVADLGQEGLLLSVAARLEEAAPWARIAPDFA